MTQLAPFGYTGPYGIYLQEWSEPALEQSLHPHLHEKPSLHLTIKFMLYEDKLALPDVAPKHSLSRAILLCAHNNSAGLYEELHDHKGRLWLVKGVEFDCPPGSKNRVGRIDLVCPGAFRVEGFPKDFLGREAVLEYKPQPRNNLLREKGDWKCT